jgi:hypothetical protein
VRVLVDHCLPRHLAAELIGHDATTVRAQRWSALRNGVLLRAAVEAGFEVFITNDSSIEFQQNVARIGIAVIAIVRFSKSDGRPEASRPTNHRGVDENPTGAVGHDLSLAFFS